MPKAPRRTFFISLFRARLFLSACLIVGPTRPLSIPLTPTPRLSVYLRAQLCPALYLAAAALLATPALHAAHDPTSIPPDYYMRTWTTDEGLPHNSVAEMVQDTTGYLWLATAGGLARFDGYQFKEIPLPARYRAAGYNIRRLVEEDPHTLVFLPTSGEVVRLRGEEFSVHPVSALIAGRQPMDLFVEPGGALWVGLLDGDLLRWEKGQARWFGKADGVPERELRFTFALDGAGRTWVANGTFLARYDRGHLVPATVDVGESMCIYSGKNGEIWICTDTRMLQFTDGRLTPVLSNPPWRGAFGILQRVFADRDGALWFACGRRGLFRWTGGPLVRIETAYPIVLSVSQDREGSLWVTTGGSGLGQLHRKSYQLFDTQVGLAENVSNAVLHDPAGTVWLANNSGGIVRVNGAGLEALDLALDGKPLYLSTLTFDGEGRLWSGGREGLYRVAPPFTAPPEKLPVPDRNLHLLQRMSTGDIWFAANPGLFGYYRQGQPHLLTEAEGYRGQVIRTIAEDRAGHVWAGTFSGDLFRYQDGKLTQLSAVDGLNGQPIHHLLPDADSDDLWVATAGGLLLGQKGRFHLFTKEDGLADDLIGHVLDDKQGRLWLSSRSGLYYVAKSELLAAARGEAPFVFSHRFGREQGLLGVSPRYNYHPAAQQTPDGRLWFITSKGVVAVAPNTLPQDLPPPPVFIEDVRVNSESVSDREHMEIPRGRHRLEFHFAALSYASPESVRIRHRLEGADPTWVDTSGTRAASYSGLAPGTYRLRVMASNMADRWHEAETSVVFRVLPAWWQNFWVLLACAVTVGAGVALGLRQWSQRQVNRRLRQLEQEHALERERARISRDLHDELGGRLTETNFLIERLRQAPSTELPTGLVILAGHVRHLSTELASIVWTVSPKNSSLDELAAFLRRYAVRFFKHTPVSTTLNEISPIPPLPLTPEAQHNLLSVAKESLTNVGKHAQATRVTLDLSFADDTFQLTVTDNGVGFDLQDTANTQGNGLSSMRSRVTEIGARLIIDSSPGRGTAVRLFYPCFPR